MPYKNRDVQRQKDLEFYHKCRNELIALLGGKCVNCGSKERLEFDHIDPTIKQIDIQALIKGRYWNHFEIKKIQLLCHDCHKIKTAKETSARYNKICGSGRTAYNRCGPPKCVLCKEWNRRSNGGCKIPPVTHAALV